MSADGEVEVAVRAEGVDDATGEMGADTLAETGGEDGPGTDRGGSGRFGKLLTRIAATLAFLGPILKVIGVISDILEAFIAPLAVLLLRLLGPALRELIQVLPVWYDIIGAIISYIPTLERMAGGVFRIIFLLGSIITELSNIKIEDIKNAITDLPGDIFDKFRGIDKDIGRAVVSALPGLDPKPDVDTSPVTREEVPRERRTGPSQPQIEAEGPGGLSETINLIFSGGLGTLIERGERDPNKEVY